MKTFTDTAGRVWTVQLNVDAIRRVKALAGVNLLEAAEGKLLQTLGTKDKPSDTGYREAADLFERLASITHGGPPFNRPTGVAFAPSGEFYVADGYGNARVHRFGADGQPGGEGENAEIGNWEVTEPR